MTGKGTRMRERAAKARFISIGTKLAVATFAVMAVVTAGVYLGLSRFERGKLIAAKEQAARMAGELFLRQASTPVLFDDATGIKDTVALLGQDHEVLGVELWRVPAPGRVAERIAAQLDPRETGATPRWVDAGAVDRLPDRVVFRDAVRDQDGKVLAVAAVQYSLQRENDAFRLLRRRILLVAAGAAAFLTLLLLAASRRWIVGPLERLLQAVRQVEAGERIDIRGLGGVGANDEVGRLAGAFGRMADVVDRRERDIARRNEDMKQVLDNVGQGFLVLDADGQLAAERSAIVDRWFGAPAPGQRLHDWLRAVDPKMADSLELGLESIRDGFMPLELCIYQLPGRLRHGDRHYGCTFHPILSGEILRQLVLVITDVTAEVERDQAEHAQRDLMAAVSRIIAHRLGFLDFLREAGGLVARLAGSENGTLEEDLRDLHTLKGNCGLFGLSGLPSLCHQLEERAIEQRDRPSADERARLQAAWRALTDSLAPFAGVTESRALEVSRDEYEALAAALEAKAPHAQLVATLAGWTDEPVRPRLERLGDHARALGERLGKCAIAVDLGPARLRLPHQPWNQLWPALVHVVRNAVDHGVEGREERAASGKPATATLTLTASESGGALTIVVADDGRGIDWEAVRRKAAAAGLPHASHEELVDALFADGVTTRDQATGTSGRGVGMAALRQVVTALGGHIEVESHDGRGTRFSLSFPTPAAPLRRAS